MMGCRRLEMLYSLQKALVFAAKYVVISKTSCSTKSPCESVQYRIGKVVAFVIQKSFFYFLIVCQCLMEVVRRSWGILLLPSRFFFFSGVVVHKKKLGGLQHKATLPLITF